MKSSGSFTMCLLPSCHGVFRRKHTSPPAVRERLLPNMREPPIPISAVYPSQRHLPARTRAFVDLVANLPGLSGIEVAKRANR